jgi:heme/copper-type cytochrome/quinol oxidase subunit 1
MHSLGIIGFPRRIYDYSLIFFKFQWFNSIGLIGIYLSIIILLFLCLFIFSLLFRSIERNINYIN